MVEAKSQCDFFLDLNPKRRRSSGSDVEEVEGSIHVRFLSVRQKKSKRSLLRVSASLVNLISPSRKGTSAEGFKVPISPVSRAPSPYRPPQASPAKRRMQLTWVDSMAGSVVPSLSQADIKRQEAIYELYQGETDMVEDLINVTKLYRDSLLKLRLMSAEDVKTLFGNIDTLIPVHQELVRNLQTLRRPDGTTHNVGPCLHDWANLLSAYVNFCANQIQAKAIFDEKKNEPAVDDFFQRCLASPFSRKLDLWTLLDGARGRFVKYPLLLRSILKYTPADSEEAAQLEKAVTAVEDIIKQADHSTGVARCKHSKSTLIYLFEEQRVPEIEASTSLICNGCMKNNKGSKLFVFLYDKVVVVSRSTNQNGRQMYQLYRQPIPVSELLVEDLADGEVKLGSFRNAFGQGGQIAKNIIRISFRDPEKGQGHTLLASDEHDKRQWMNAFQKVTEVTVVPETTKNKQAN